MKFRDTGRIQVGFSSFNVGFKYQLKRIIHREITTYTHWFKCNNKTKFE